MGLSLSTFYAAAAAGQTTAAPATDWSAAGHANPDAVIELLSWIGVGVWAALVLLFIVRAWFARARYSALTTLDSSAKQLVADAVQRAESETVGELVVVVLERSDRHPAAEWLSALTFTLLGSSMLAGFLPWGRPELLLGCQLALGGVGYWLAAHLPSFKRVFMSEARASEMAAEQATQEFYRHRLHETEARTGVLIFVSLLEHRVLVLADEGIDAKVSSEDWVHVDNAVLSGIKQGTLVDGLCEGVRQAGKQLAQHFPWQEGDRDELPNHVEVRVE
jgi:putative membrane protein